MSTYQPTKMVEQHPVLDDSESNVQWKTYGEVTSSPNGRKDTLRSRYQIPVLMMFHGVRCFTNLTFSEGYLYPSEKARQNRTLPSQKRYPLPSLSPDPAPPPLGNFCPLDSLALATAGLLPRPREQETQTLNTHQVVFKITFQLAV